MNREMPQPRSNNSELPPGMQPPTETSSGTFRSSLGKALQRDTKIPPEKKWARQLVDSIPQAYLGMATEFVHLFPHEAEKAAETLFEEINKLPRGVLGAPDQKEALRECIRKATSRLAA